MNSANTEWIAQLKPGTMIRHKSGGSGYVVNSNDGQSAVAVRAITVTNPDEWEIVPAPPPRPKTLEDVDREAYDHWATSTGQITQRSAWLAARASLREEHAVALKEFIESPAGMTNGVWVNREGFYKLTALLKGEQ